MDRFLLLQDDHDALVDEQILTERLYHLHPLPSQVLNDLQHIYLLLRTHLLQSNVECDEGSRSSNSSTAVDDHGVRGIFSFRSNGLREVDQVIGITWAAVVGPLEEVVVVDGVVDVVLEGDG